MSLTSHHAFFHCIVAPVVHDRDAVNTCPDFVYNLACPHEKLIATPPPSIEDVSLLRPWYHYMTLHFTVLEPIEVANCTALLNPDTKADSVALKEEAKW
jgi:hypothetical protein